MTEKEKIKFIEYLRLKTKLKNASDNGALLMFEGRYSDAETIAQNCVFHDTGYYMNEIAGNRSGKADVIFVGLGDDDL